MTPDRLRLLREDLSDERFQLALKAIAGFIDFCIENEDLIGDGREMEDDPLDDPYGVEEMLEMYKRQFGQPFAAKGKPLDFAQTALAIIAQRLEIEDVHTAIENRFYENSNISFLVLKEKISQTVATGEKFS